MESFDWGRVGPGELGVTAIFDGFNEDGTGFNLDHNHDVVINGWEQWGSFPVWSVKMVSWVSYTLVKMSHFLWPWSCRDQKSSNGMVLGLVEYTFFRVWLR